MCNLLDAGTQHAALVDDSVIRHKIGIINLLQLAVYIMGLCYIK